jgi:hypothetical protein
VSKARALQRMRPTVWRTLAQTCQDRGVDVPSDSGCLVPSIDLREAAVRAYQADAVGRYPWIGRADGWPGLRFGCALWNDNKPGPQMVIARAMGAAEGADIAYAMGTAGPEWMADAFDAPGDGADCSDLIAYCIGRRKAGGPDWTRASDGAWWWLSTDSVWSDARGPQLLFRRIDEPAGPCIAVYPDGHGRQGHIGLVVSVHGSILRGVDCSSSQYGRWDDAARLRDLSFFDDAKRRARGRLFCVPSWW